MQANTARMVVFLIAVFGGLQTTAAPVSLNAAQDARFRAIAAEVRCLVCQNQSVLDSSAGLAGDLRRELKRLIVEGRTEGEIKDYLVERYSDFVLYKPPLKISTLALWFGPLLLLLIALGIAFRVITNSRPDQSDFNELHEENSDR